MPRRRAPRRVALASLAQALACTNLNPPPPEPAQPPVSAPPTAPELRSPEPRAAPAGEHELVARVVDAGPIGDGRCTQRSYQIEVVETIAGAPLTSPAWVHFERCEGDDPGAPAFDGGGLEIGGRYRLRLQDGRSPNFGADPMIVAADPAP
ncbi:MAG: hypothetical protein H6711_33855 [Myxococcales bacterium]|nr:hypothetical protein [Myxococcales bacterium]